MNVSGRKIFAGLSGGVDSAVSAALLQKAGAHVTGVFIKGWYPPGMPCTWAEDRRDAMRVAARLGIPFHTLDASAEYKKGVIDYLLAEYAAGRTPNPDVMCNREVKFGAFYEFAKANEAEFIATGHYAQSHDGKLFRGLDESKDQSYFLWAIPSEALAHTIFPVGGIPKSEVRKLAAKFDLPVATKKDSQGVCFLGSISVDEFLRRELHPAAGKAVDVGGIEVGMHDGTVLYTLGERIALTGAGPGPWFVVKKDLRENVLTVSHEHFVSEENRHSITLRETNWFGVSDMTPTVELKVEAQYRYHGPRISGTLTRADGGAVTFTPTEALTEQIAEGQSLVIYIDEECIGGGIIS